MFNIFKKLLPKDTSEAEPTADEIAAQEKADRIAYHRTQVRNGPVSFKYQTAGQQRRAAARAQKRDVRKNFKREVRGYFEKQRVSAVLRPHLQVLGLVPSATGRTFTMQDEIVSTAWIVQRYGKETEVDGAKTGHVSLFEDDVRASLSLACDFYRSATGYEIHLPTDFELAIYADLSA